MKTVKDKYLVVGADFAGFPLKEVVVEHLEKKGWKILDLGVKKDSDLIILAFVIGVTVFLLMVYPFIFWLIFVPLVVLGIIKFITWLKK